MNCTEPEKMSRMHNTKRSPRNQCRGWVVLGIAMSLSLSTVALFSGPRIPIKPGQLAPSHAPTAAMTVAGNPLVSSSGAGGYSSRFGGRIGSRTAVGAVGA